MFGCASLHYVFAWAWAFVNAWNFVYILFACARNFTLGGRVRCRSVRVCAELHVRSSRARSFVFFGVAHVRKAHMDYERQDPRQTPSTDLRHTSWRKVPESDARSVEPTSTTSFTQLLSSIRVFFFHVA